MTVAVDKVELAEDNPISYRAEKKQSEIELQPLTSTHDGDGDGDGIGFDNDEGLGKQHHHDVEAYTHPIHEARPWNLQDWLYPPDLPRSCQLLRRENIAIPACYLLVGLLQGLSGPLINVYPLDLGATEAQQVTLSSIRSLPASFSTFVDTTSSYLFVSSRSLSSHTFLIYIQNCYLVSYRTIFQLLAIDANRT
jgi:hypothetical protein